MDDEHGRLAPELDLLGLQARLGCQVSTRILGRRTAPFPTIPYFLTASRMVLPQDPSTYRGLELFALGAVGHGVFPKVLHLREGLEAV